MLTQMVRSESRGQLFLAYLLALAFTAPDAPADIYVPADYATIQAAIDALPDEGGTVVVADGTYTGTGNRDIKFPGGKPITLRSANGRDVCIIDCEGSADHPHIALYFDNGEDAASEIDGFTVRSGFADPNQGGGYGGAVHCEKSSATIRNCVFEHNTAGRGGAIWAHLCPRLTLENCLFTENTAQVHGGALYPNSEGAPGYTVVTVTNCTFTRNTAGGGGAVRNVSAQVTYTNCAFVENTSTNSGSGSGAIGSFTFARDTWKNCRFVRNQAARIGGAIWMIDNEQADLTNCTFEGNSALHGGTLAITVNGSLNVTNCLFTGNQISAGDRLASAIWVGDGLGGPSSATIRNCTFSGNVGPAGSGALAVTQTSTADVANCVFWGNSPAGIALTESATIEVSYSDVKGGWDGDGNIEADPLFVRNPSPGDDGEWGTDDDDYGDLRLTADSPCIDTGDPAFDPPPGTRELDGHKRIWDGDEDGETIVDMGVYEFGSHAYGDLNCDGGVDFNDIDAFVAALISQEDYEQSYPDCDYALADVNSDGSVDFADIDGFVACLINGGCE